MSAPVRPTVVLVGPPGAGKTTVAEVLAGRWGTPARDTDAEVERVAGKPVTEIFVEDGEERFRELERAAVLAALDADGAERVAEGRHVLALGGGAVLHPDAQTALAAYRADGGLVVFLDVTLAHAASRVGFNQPRPLSGPR
jgi:shikimate kinase